MGLTQIQTTLVAPQGGGLKDIIDDQVEAMRAIMRVYIPGLGNFLKGIRPIGDESIPVPCLMLQARKFDPQFITTAKMHRYTMVQMVYYVGNDNPETAALMCSNVAVILAKLFSNNGLSDIMPGGVGFGVSPYGDDPYGDPYPDANSNSFYQYDPYWLSATVTEAGISPLFKFWGDNGPKYVAIGTFQLKLERVELV